MSILFTSYSRFDTMMIPQMFLQSCLGVEAYVAALPYQRMLLPMVLNLMLDQLLLACKLHATA